MDARGCIAWLCVSAVVLGSPSTVRAQQSIEHRAYNPLASAMPVTASNRDQFTAKHETENFVVFARTAEAAAQVAEVAERSRYELAQLWLGKPFDRPWRTKCPVYVRDWLPGAGGATTFTFSSSGNGAGPMEVGKWKMDVQGPLDRILDSVVPHEVNHTIFATYFRQPLPRWADEGAATLMECDQERRRQQLLVRQVLDQKAPIPLQKLFDMTEYPNDMQRVYTLYAQGYSIVDLLVQKGGRGKFIDFVRDALRAGWDRSLAHHYRIESVASLEKEWNGWVLAGSPPQKPRAGVKESDTMMAAANVTPRSSGGEKGGGSSRRTPPPRNGERPLVRGQAPNDSPRNSRESTDDEGSAQESIAESKTPPIPTREPKPGAASFDAFESNPSAVGTLSRSAGSDAGKSSTGKPPKRKATGRSAVSTYDGEMDDEVVTKGDEDSDDDDADINADPPLKQRSAVRDSWPLMADQRDGPELQLGRRAKGMTTKAASPPRSIHSDRHAEKLTPPWRRSQRTGSEVASSP